MRRNTVGLGLVLGVVGCGTNPAAVDDPLPSELTTPGWNLLPTSPVSPEHGRHDDLAMLTPDLGWLVNTRGEIYRTEDGGASWEWQLHLPDVPFRSVGFATPDIGWVGSLNGFRDPDPRRALYETRNGGATWTNITDRVVGPEPVGICGIWVVDPTTVFAVGRWHGPAVFVRTNDGGLTWESKDLAPMVNGLVDVRFFDRERGLVIGGRGVGPDVDGQNASVTVILGTEDGGDHWTIRYETDRLGSWGWKFSFPTPEIGYAAEQGPTRHGIVLKTTDGGVSWREIQVGAGLEFSGIGFATAELGWVGSDEIWETRDGGTTWSAVGWGDRINRFRMLDGVGFAAGRRVYRWNGDP